MSVHKVKAARRQPPAKCATTTNPGFDGAEKLFLEDLAHQLLARLTVEKADQLQVFVPGVRTARIAPELGLERRALARVLDHIFSHDVGVRIAIGHQAVDLAGKFGVVGAVPHVAVNIGIVFGDPFVDRIGDFRRGKIAGPHGNVTDDVERSEFRDFFTHDVGMDRENALLDEVELDADFLLQLGALRLDRLHQ